MGKIKMITRLAISCLLFVACSSFAADDPEVRIDPSHLQGPRTLEKQTETAAIGDYLQAWQSLKTAFAEGRTDLLDRSFVGDARDKLSATIAEQGRLGIHTRYQDRAHNLQIVFYSPEGLSIQILDRVEYEVQIFDHEKVIANQRVDAQYIALLTPSEVRWKVRILQGQAGRPPVLSAK